MKKRFFALVLMLILLSAIRAFALEITVETSSGSDWQKAVFTVNGKEYTVTNQTGDKYVSFAENGSVGTIRLQPDGQYEIIYAVTPAPETAATATPIPIPAQITPTPIPVVTAVPTATPAAPRTLTFDDAAEGTRATLSGGPEGTVTVNAVEIGIVYTTLHLEDETLRLRTYDITFSDAIQSNLKTCVVRTKGTLRESADKDSEKCGSLVAGTIAVVLEISGDGEYARVKTDGGLGWIRTANIDYYGEWNAEGEGIVTYKGKTTGTGNVFIRSKADRDSDRVTKWHVGTNITILSQTRDWYEAEANGMHGWIMKDNVTLTEGE